MHYKIHSGLNQNIVVYKWLKKLSDLVVPYSVFLIAAGALLVHDNKVLMVQEKGVILMRYRAQEGVFTVFLEVEPTETS